jgi:hypothetical protein
MGRDYPVELTLQQARKPILFAAALLLICVLKERMMTPLCENHDS